MKFDRFYFMAAIMLFLTEALIAAFMHDAFIRPVFGDFLVVILVYCGLRSFFNITYSKAVVASVVFAYVVEGLQYIHLINLLGLQDSLAAHLILGAGFSWIDMLAYTLGGLTTWIIEYVRIDLNKEFKTLCKDL